MDICLRRKFCWHKFGGSLFTSCVCLFAFFFLLLSGCQQAVRTDEADAIDPAVTIGSLAEVFAIDKIMVEGYGLVGDLRGQGSQQCPPAVRDYLEKYIRRQLPAEKDVAKYIDSSNTAMVLVQALMPAAVRPNTHFDLKVTSLTGTETTSLDGGVLLGAELWQTGTFAGGAKALATAQGPVFIDKISGRQMDEKSGYVLGGGLVLDEYKITVAIGDSSDYRITSQIRNRLNERFGDAVAWAKGPGQIELTVPPKYQHQKDRFISLVKATYLTQTHLLTAERIKTHVKELVTSSDKSANEIALEAIGKVSVKKLKALLNSSNEEVRLRAARCMLNLGSDAGIETLSELAMDKESDYRTEAIEAVATSASRNDVALICRKLLADADFQIRLAAYEKLRKLGDISISQRTIADSFYLEQIRRTQAKQKVVYVARSDQPTIVLFGAPIYCEDDVFVRSDDEKVTINAPAGAKEVIIIIKDQKLGPVKLKCAFELNDIIRTLCEKPLDKKFAGLNISYSDVVAILKKMCEKGAVKAEFYAGSIPKISEIIKN